MTLLWKWSHHFFAYSRTSLIQSYVHVPRCAALFIEVSFGGFTVYSYFPMHYLNYQGNQLRNYCSWLLFDKYRIRHHIIVPIEHLTYHSTSARFEVNTSRGDKPVFTFHSDWTQKLTQPEWTQIGSKKLSFSPDKPDKLNVSTVAQMMWLGER